MTAPTTIASGPNLVTSPFAHGGAGRSLTGRVAALAAAVVVTWFVLQGWAPPVGPATHQPRSETSVDTARTQAEAAGIDVDRVAEQVGHRVGPGPRDTLVAEDGAYRAVFDKAGFSYGPTNSENSLSISLSGVERQGGALPLAPRAWRGEANAAVREVGPAISERVTAREGAVEWDLVLARPPVGRGPLTVTGHLDGIRGAAQRTSTAAGRALRFTLADGTPVDLGELVVKDAHGGILHRALPEVTGDQIRLVVPASVLDRNAYPLTVDPTVSSPTTVSGPGNRALPAVAFDGSNTFLVVWQDQRSTSKDIYGARVNGSGQLLDPAGIAIADQLSDQLAPDVAWNGNVFLVVWQHKSPASYDLLARRVSAAGTPLGSSILVAIPEGSSDQAVPAVAAAGATTAGTDFMVVWGDTRGGQTIYGARVSTDGTVRDQDGFLVAGGAADGSFSTKPDVAWNGSRFLVVWASFDTIINQGLHVKAARVSVAGQLEDFKILVSVNSPSVVALDPAVASDGANFLVVWQDNRNGNSVYGARVNGNGTVLDPANIPISPGNNSEHPAVAYNSTYLVIWRDQRTPGNADLFAARVNSSGGVLDPGGFGVSTSATAAESFPALSRGPGVKWGSVYESGTSPSASIVFRTTPK